MKFTVFTPTYNRAHTLHRVLDSALDQTIADFEWLVIDNGSDDGTGALVQGWAESITRFPIRYYNEPRKGKHFCHNRALELAQGEFFLVADSDDGFSDIALECFDKRWNEIPIPLRKKCCGVASLCVDPDDHIIGDLYPWNDPFMTLTDRLYRHRIRGEHWGMMRTDIVRKYPFPEIDSFVPEGLVWLQIARDGYYDYCCNDPLRIYWGDEPDSLSRLGLTRGKIIYCREMFKYDWPYALSSPVRFIKAGLIAAASPLLLPLTSR